MEIENKASKQEIRLILLTGFLGAGKTTLMKEILEAYSNYKVGVIVNEFGEINIDSKLINRQGIEIAELNNGSIFCACIKDKFLDSLIEMSKLDLEYVFIEASGLADPANMVSILKAIYPKTDRKYDYQGSICVLDAQNFLDLLEVLSAIEAQLSYCSAIIINKSDLIDETTLKKILEKIIEINLLAESYITSFCKVDMLQIAKDMEGTNKLSEKSAVVKGIQQNPLNERFGISQNTYETRPESFVVKYKRGISKIVLTKFLMEIAKYTYRIKGFADTDKGKIEISCVAENINITPYNFPVEYNEIVVISAVGFKMMSIILENIEKHAKGLMWI